MYAVSEMLFTCTDNYILQPVSSDQSVGSDQSLLYHYDWNVEWILY